MRHVCALLWRVLKLVFTTSVCAYDISNGTSSEWVLSLESPLASISLLLLGDTTWSPHNCGGLETPSCSGDTYIGDTKKVSINKVCRTTFSHQPASQHVMTNAAGATAVAVAKIVQE